MRRRPPSANRPFAAAAASWLVALALLLRLLLPALHHHHGEAHHEHGAAVAVCSCGQVHERAPATPRGDGQLDAAEVEAPHFCIACDVELGTPGAGAGAPAQLPSLASAALLPCPRTGRLTALAADRRPPTRAPPARSC